MARLPAALTLSNSSISASGSITGCTNSLLITWKYQNASYQIKELRKICVPENRKFKLSAEKALSFGNVDYGQNIGALLSEAFFDQKFGKVEIRICVGPVILF